MVSFDLINLGPDDGMAPVRRQALIWTSADLWPFGIESNYKPFHLRDCIWKWRLQNVGYCVQTPICFSKRGSNTDCQLLLSGDMVVTMVVSMRRHTISMKAMSMVRSGRHGCSYGCAIAIPSSDVNVHAMWLAVGMYWPSTYTLQPRTPNWWNHRYAQGRV